MAIDFKKVEQGSAQEFRETINDNFSKISDSLFNIEYSKIQPGTTGGPAKQKKGDFWFKIL